MTPDEYEREKARLHSDMENQRSAFQRWVEFFKLRAETCPELSAAQLAADADALLGEYLTRQAQCSMVLRHLGDQGLALEARKAAEAPPLRRSGS